MIVGVDEAGRGPLVGSVVAAAVWLPEHMTYENPGPLGKVKDSKKMTESVRIQMESVIKAESIAFGVGCATAAEIDQLNILNATFLAMQRAIEKMVQSSGQVIPIELIELKVDGNRLSTWMKQAGFRSLEAIVKGDSKLLAISAASVLAKVERDRQMENLDKLFPQYGFLKHKGYGTAQHMQAIQEYGACSEHRMTFAPLKTMF